MTKTRIIILVALVLLLIFLPKQAKGDEELPANTPVVVEVVSIPSKVKPEYDQYYLMAYAEFKNEPVMLAIGMAESGFNPKAKNPNSTAKGIYQILDGTWKAHKCEGDVYDPVDNIKCARKIYEDSGTKPWDASGDFW